MKRLHILLPLASAWTGLWCSPPADLSEAIKSRRFELIWADEFDGPAGQPPDSSKWNHDIGTDWGNAQLEYDTDSTDNVALDGEGHLAITARKEAYEGSEYSSGRISTKALFSQAYGRFEARLKQPVGRGMWPAFWLLGANVEEVSWPACGEIDVMEYRGQEPRKVLGTIHGPGYSAQRGVGASHELDEGLHEDFHVYAIEWDPERIVWYLDDRLYHIVTPAALPPLAGPWVFDHPFFALLNLAVGGRFVGPPDDSTMFPQTLLVDYVRVYERLP